MTGKILVSNNVLTVPIHGDFQTLLNIKHRLKTKQTAGFGDISQ
jgi:hypothetical protein